jgi:hypothetical protein
VELGLQPFAGYLAGCPETLVLVIKGQAGAAEAGGGKPFSGPDGEALDKALSALGWSAGGWLGVLLTAPGLEPLSAEQLRLLCEIVDPLLIIALDEVARQSLREAFARPRPGLAADFEPGARSQMLGRVFVSVDGFESSLADQAAKQRCWAQLKQAAKQTVHEFS